jgi:hypothetical protein
MSLVTFSMGSNLVYTNLAERNNIPRIEFILIVEINIYRLALPQFLNPERLLSIPEPLLECLGSYMHPLTLVQL